MCRALCQYIKHEFTHGANFIFLSNYKKCQHHIGTKVFIVFTFIHSLVQLCISAKYLKLTTPASQNRKHMLSFFFLLLYVHLVSLCTMHDKHDDSYHQPMHLIFAVGFQPFPCVPRAPWHFSTSLKSSPNGKWPHCLGQLLLIIPLRFHASETLPTQPLDLCVEAQQRLSQLEVL